MGYEVLDSEGVRRPPPPSADRHPVDVLDLDDLPAPDGDAPQAGWPLLRGRLARGGLAAARTPATARRAAALIVVTLAVGAVGGALVTRRHERDLTRRAERSVLAVSAVGSTSSVSAQGSVVSVQLLAQVVNSGPLPVVVLTGSRTTATGMTAVTTRRGSPDLAPGAATSLGLTLPVDCSPGAADPVLSFGVRTADGRRHDVPVDLLDESVSRQSLCAQATPLDPQAVDVSLVGSLERPVLRLRNDAEGPVSVTTSSPAFPDETGVNAQVVTVTTDPSTPVEVAGGSTLDVALHVVARRCPRDLRLLAGAGYLQVDWTGPGLVATGSSGVDLGPLLGAALAATCAS